MRVVTRDIPYYSMPPKQQIKSQFDRTAKIHPLPLAHSTRTSKDDEMLMFRTCTNCALFKLGPKDFMSSIPRHHIVFTGRTRHGKVLFIACKAQEANCYGIACSTMYIGLIMPTLPQNIIIYNNKL